MRKERHFSLGFYTIGVAALFLAGFFLLVVFGAQSYRNTVKGQNGNMQSRALQSYLSTTVKAYDAADAVSLTEEPEVGQVLALADGSSGYALRIYRKDGMLLEDYASADAALNPEEAQRLGMTERFEAEKLPGNLLKLRTDAGSVLLHLRSFYLETLMLIVVFVLIILVLTQVFGLAQMQSTRAKELNGAVILAQNAAEAVAASETPEELLKLLNENGNAVPMTEPAGVTARYDRDLNPDAEGNYRVDVTWLPEETENGILVHSVAEVRCEETEAPVYRLETERFRTGVSA